MFSILEAAESSAKSGGFQSTLMSLLPLVLIFVIFYFLLIRPQKKKQRKHIDLVASIKGGEKVILNSGIKGIVTKVKDNTFFIEIASNTEIEVLKSHIAHVEG